MERIFVWRFWRRASLGVTLATTWVDGVAGSSGGERGVDDGQSRCRVGGESCGSIGRGMSRFNRGASQRGPSVDNPSMKAE